MAGTSVSVVARGYDVNANLLFHWRDDPRYASQEQSFLPVEINPTGQELAPPRNSLCLQRLGYGSRVMFALLSKAGLNPRS